MTNFNIYLKKMNPLYYIGKTVNQIEETKMWMELESNGVDFIEQLDSDIRGHSKYQMTRPNHIRLVKEFLARRDITSKDAILDIGCGKGGMIYVFHCVGFVKADGIDYSEELCLTACANMERLGIKSHVKCVNAAEYEAYDDYNYIYMYNPFGEDIMRKVVFNIGRSLKRKPRKIRIIYANPNYGYVLDEAGYILTDTLRSSILFPETVAVYNKESN